MVVYLIGTKVVRVGQNKALRFLQDTLSASFTISMTPLVEFTPLVLFVQRTQIVPPHPLLEES